MGKRYYCDYCDRAFPDSAQNRKKHLQGVLHQKLQKLHYDSFRDTATMLKEELAKRPCRKFTQEGYCQFGPGCKYSHMTPDDIENMKRKAALEQQQKEEKSREGAEFDLDAWLKNHVTKKDQLDKPKQCVVPSVSDFPVRLLESANLTPSLIPARFGDFLSYHIAEWES